MKKKVNWLLRFAGLVMVVTGAWNLSWLMQTVNPEFLSLSLVFVAANAFTLLYVSLTVINNWSSSSYELGMVAEGEEDDHAVILPIVNEPAGLLEATIGSLLVNQNWPHERLIVVVSDDGHRSDIKDMTADFKRRYPAVRFHYNRPPKRGSPDRRGNAKDGNLNDSFDKLMRLYPGLKTVETRDCDDLATPNFIRMAVYQLERNPRLGFVQTRKEAITAEGDPFNHEESLFYKAMMPSKDAQNMAFPCGSGVVYRTDALQDIDGFSTAGLVEDLSTGVELYKIGWHGAYLKFVGAIAQIAPENLRDSKQQRGTWATDTMHMFWFRNPLTQRGLSLRQRLGFFEMGMFYLHSIAMGIYFLTATLGLLGFHAVLGNSREYIAHIVPYVISIFVFLAALAKELPFEDLLKSWIVSLGFAPVYAHSCWKALKMGRSKKPAYKVTPKVKSSGIFIKEARIHLMLLAVAVLTVIRYFLVTPDLLQKGELGTMFWLVLMCLPLTYFISLSWHGTRFGWLIPVWKPARQVTKPAVTIILMLVLLLLIG